MIARWIQNVIQPLLLMSEKRIIDKINSLYPHEETENEIPKTPSLIDIRVARNSVRR